MPTQKMPLPPQIPQSEEKLERAICLLGSRTKVELSSKSARELVALVGHYPNPQEAAVWKQYLKQMLKSKQQCYKRGLITEQVVVVYDGELAVKL